MRQKGFAPVIVLLVVLLLGVLGYFAFTKGYVGVNLSKPSASVIPNAISSPSSTTDPTSKNEKGNIVGFYQVDSICTNYNIDTSLTLSTKVQTYFNKENNFKLNYPDNLKLYYFKNINGGDDWNTFSLLNEAEIKYDELLQQELNDYKARGEVPPGHGGSEPEIVFNITNNPNKDVLGFTLLMLTTEDQIMITNSIKDCRRMEINGNKAIIEYKVPKFGGERDILIIKLKDKDEYITLSVSSASNGNSRILDMLIANMFFTQ